MLTGLVTTLVTLEREAANYAIPASPQARNETSCRVCSQGWWGFLSTTHLRSTGSIIFLIFAMWLFHRSLQLSSRKWIPHNRNLSLKYTSNAACNGAHGSVLPAAHDTSGLPAGKLAALGPPTRTVSSTREARYFTVQSIRAPGATQWAHQIVTVLIIGNWGPQTAAATCLAAPAAVGSEKKYLIWDLY
jgi:hypothetical protein